MPIISRGNTKLGAIPNVNLSPIKSCGNCSACAKDCYAMKAYRMYPNVRKAWDSNLEQARTDPATFFYEINGYLCKRKPKYFRWHSSGDILGQDYLDRMVQIARNRPETKFLCFTKMFWLDYYNLPGNLSILGSMFPLMAQVWFGRTAWMQDGTEHRVSVNAKKCPGSCAKCKHCWNSKRDVYFIKH